MRSRDMGGMFWRGSKIHEEIRQHGDQQYPAAWKMAADKDTAQFWTIWATERFFKTDYIEKKSL